MYISKKDQAFYTYEKIALATIVGMQDSDDYLGEDGCRELMQRISNAFNISCPKFKLARKDSGFCYYRKIDNSIYYNPYWGLTTPTVLHEMTHAVDLYDREFSKNDIHGPIFVRKWIDIVSRMYDIDAKIFEELADKRNIEYKKRDIILEGGYKPKYG